MRTLQIFQPLQLVERFSERVTEGRNYTRVTAILAVCFIALPVFIILLKNSKLHFFESFDSTSKPLEETASNFSAKILGGIPENITALPAAADGQNSTSKPLEETASNFSAKILGGIPENITALPADVQNSTSESSTNDSKPIISDQPKLVDELVASGFVKESCISRYQYSSYHKNKPYKPSPYLISKLRGYEELHRRCGPESLSYRKVIRMLSRAQHINDNATTLCKYLVWTPSNGLGNRMVSMASAFLYSLLENRVFLVEFEADMDGLFCEPFPNSTWLLPQNFPHKNNWSKLPSFKYRANSGEGGFSPSFIHLELQHGHGDHNIRHFHCNGTLPSLEKIPIVILNSDQYFVPSLFMITSYQQELNKMFPQKDAVFHHLGHYLFNPSNEAWGLITRFYEAYLANADEKIGLQIRVFDHQKASSQNIISQILSCTLTHNILPSLDNTQKSLKFLWKNSTSKSKAVLVASLYPEYAEKLRSMYWTRPTLNGDAIGVYQPSHEEYQKFHDNMHNMKAWAEIYLLSLCDVLVTSPQSTFGYVAQGLGALKPWILVRLGKNNDPNSSCKRDSSMEPCFHVPPVYDCKGKTKITNFTKLYPHINTCDDVFWGVKLVDI